MSDFHSRRSRQQPVRQPRSSSANDLYRRSRTLTGSISSRVSSAVEMASQLKSSRLETHELKTHRRRIGIWLAGALAGVGLSLWLIDSMIVLLQPSDAVSERYIQTVDDYLDQNFPQRLYGVLNQSQLLEYAQTKHPELESLTISGADQFASHTVSVAIRTPVAMWTIGSDTFYVDRAGVGYTDIASGVVPSGLIVIKDESGLPLASQQLASRSMMQFIGQVVAQINISGIGRVVEVVLPPGTLKQIDVVLEGRPYRIKLNSDRDPVGQVHDVVKAIQYLDATSRIPQYVDVRVEGKAFYQ